MNGSNPFSTKIETIRTERATSGNFAARDICLSRFEKIWQPLIDHMQKLADRHLPADKRLRIGFEVQEDLTVHLNLAIDHDQSADNPEDPIYKREDLRWRQLQQTQFYKPASNGGLLGLLTGRLNLKDVFRRSALNDFALTSLQISDKDPKLKNASLHPARMEEAKEVVEYWLAKQMAFGFDSALIHPKSNLQVTIQRNNSGPENRP